MNLCDIGTLEFHLGTINASFAEKKWQYCQKIFVKREFIEPFGFLVFYQIQGPCYRISW